MFCELIWNCAGFVEVRLIADKPDGFSVFLQKISRCVSARWLVIINYQFVNGYFGAVIPPPVWAVVCKVVRNDSNEFIDKREIGSYKIVYSSLAM